MTAAAEAPSAFPGPDGGRPGLWISAAALALAAHAGAVVWTLRAPPAPPLDAGAPVVMIEMAPEPAAPAAEDHAIGDHMTEVEEILERVQEPLPQQPPDPAVPLPVQTQPEPPPAMLTAPPALLPEVALPPPSDQPLARPRDLQPAEVPPEPARQREPDRPKPEAPKRKEPASKEPPRQQQHRAASEAPRSAAAPAASSSAQGAGGAAAEAKWRGRLLAHLERRKRYPAGARARREEGTAMVRFSVDGAGNVLSVSLHKSSGSPDLDEAVLSLVRRASPVPAPPPDAARTITAPVNFSIR